MLVSNGQRDSLQVGNRVITNLNNIIALIGVCNGAALGNSTLRVPFAAAGRAVTAAKTFRVLSIRLTASTAGGLLFGYADADVGVGVVTALTNPIYANRNSGVYSINVAANQQLEMAVQWDVPAGKYLAISNGGGALVGTCEAFGYEF